jgi:FkbM family methyltransferase
MNVFRWSVAGMSFDLIEDQDSIVKLLRRGQEFEPATLQRWADYCREGGTVVDVGCYTGIFSMIAARLGCRVLAFEPMPANYRRCVENFALNGVEVELEQKCVNATAGPTVIKFNPRVPFLTSGASLVRPSGGKESQDLEVEGVTIDSLGLEQCAAIKIDVERGEAAVLAGAKETIDRCKPALFVEVLGPAEGREIWVDGYGLAAVLDDRNWLMLPI